MASKRRKTGFDKFFEEQMADANFREGFEMVRREIDAVDRLVRALDAARMDLGLSKAELARKIGAKPAMVRRLFTADRANPTLVTVVKLADALGYDLSLVPKAPTSPARAKAATRRRKSKKRSTRGKRTAAAVHHRLASQARQGLITSGVAGADRLVRCAFQGQVRRQEPAIAISAFDAQAPRREVEEVPDAGDLQTQVAADRVACPTPCRLPRAAPETVNRHG